MHIGSIARDVGRHFGARTDRKTGTDALGCCDYFAQKKPPVIVMTSSGAYPPLPSEYLSAARNVGLDRDTGRSLAGASVTHSRRDAAAWSNIAGARRRHRTIAPHAARAPRHLPLAARPHDASASSSLLAAPVHLAHRGLAAETTSPSA